MLWLVRTTLLLNVLMIIAVAASLHGHCTYLVTCTYCFASLLAQYVPCEVLFKMYGDSTRGGLVGRKGIQAFILDILAASPPPFAPVEHQRQAGDRGETNGVGLDQPPAGHARLNSSARDSFSAGKMREQAAHAGTPDFEMELEHVLSRMASAVLGEVMRLSPLRMPDVGFVLRQGERELVHDASFYGHSRISCSMPVHHVDVDLNP